MPSGPLHHAHSNTTTMQYETLDEGFIKIPPLRTEISHLTK